MKWIILLLSFCLFGFALYLYNQPGFLIPAVIMQVFQHVAFGLFIVRDARERWEKIK